jgi:hypothetical protein
MEVCKVEQDLYMKVAGFLSRNTWNCCAELSESLGAYAILY